VSDTLLENLNRGTGAFLASRYFADNQDVVENLGEVVRLERDDAARPG
jgi:hypothetical protein